MIASWIEIKRNDINPFTGKCGVYIGCSNCKTPIPTDSQIDRIKEKDCSFCYSCGANMQTK